MPARTRARLLVLASTFPARPGDGTPGFVADLAAAQAETFETLVLAPRVPGSVADEQRDGYRIHRFRYFFRRWEDLAHGAILENVRSRRSRLVQVPAFALAEMLAVRRAIRAFDPDVLHVHWIIPQGLAALVAARGRPWVLTTLGGDIYALDTAPWRMVKRAVIRHAAAMTVMNVDMAHRATSLGMPADRLHVMPMGHDAIRIARAGHGADVVRGRILFAGRLVEKKGVEVLLEALEQLGLDLEWSLDIVGDGPLRRALEGRASELAGRVRFLGHQGGDALAKMWHECEIAVFPSVPARSGDQDGLPVALLEALAAGRPVIASRLAGIDEAIVDSEHGLLVPPGQPEPLARAIRTLLTDAALRDRLGRAAAVQADAYSMQVVSARYIDLLRAQL